MKARITNGGEDPERRGFRRRLQRELGLRCARNPQYSLRAFARDLGSDHATLGQLLRGKRRMTEQSIRALGGRLGIDDDAIEEYVAVQTLIGASPQEPSRALDGETAALVPAWPYDAMLEVLALDDFRPDSRWIARTLGIGVDEVNVALQQLIRLGLLDMASADRWEDLLGDATAPWAGEALPPAADACGAHAAATLAVDAERLPEAAARLSAFRAELAAFLTDSPRRDAVVRMDLHLTAIAPRGRGSTSGAVSHGDSGTPEPRDQD